MNEPLLYHFLDKVYTGAASVMPKSFQEHPELLAAGFGALGGYLLTRGIQSGIQKTAPEFYNKHLPQIEKGLALIVCTAPILYAVIDTEGANNLMKQHPVYSSGVSMGLVGGATAAFQDASKTRKTSKNFMEELGRVSGYTKKK